MIKKNLVWGYEVGRSVVYSAEFFWLDKLVRVFPHYEAPQRFEGQRIKQIFRDLFLFLRRDAEIFSQRILPMRTLAPTNSLRHVSNLPKLLFDGIRVTFRRHKKNSHDFAPAAQKFFSLVPDYYRRNFHFQTDGYLSSRSAALYEHQVELLFAGGADAMRRLIIRPLRHHFGRSSGVGLRILEVGAGTGSMSHFIKALYPDAKLTLLDLSEPYLKRAQSDLTRESFVDYVQGDAAALPFRDEQFDAVVSCFLFHELPQDVRVKVIQESARVLKPHGFFAAVDSLQKGDRPEYDWALDNFPARFHEPFFKNYIQNPLEELLKNSQFQEIKTDTGFFAKCLKGIKNEKSEHEHSAVPQHH